MLFNQKSRFFLMSLLALVMTVTGARAEGETPYAVWCVGNNTLYFTNTSEVLTASGTFTPEGATDPVTITNVWSGTDVTASADTPGWINNYNVYSKIKYVVFESSFAAVRPTKLQKWFYNCYNITGFTGIPNLNTSEVTTMAYMFYGCYFTSLDLSTFDTSKVTTMNYMFSNCYNLTDLNLSGWTNTQVTNMAYMFGTCQKLSNLTLTGFCTPAVTDMNCMFSSCKALTNLDLSGFNTGKVTNMSSMFSSCSELTSLNLSGWTNTLVTNMGSMFSQCQKLATLNMTGFGTPAVTNMASMFSNCKQLASLDLSSFNTANVTTMASMFYNCNSLATLNLGSNFNTASVTTMSSMFNGCKLLQAVDVSGFNTAKVTTMANMFKDCNALTSLNVSSFSSAGMPTSGNGEGYMYCMFQNCYNLQTLTLGADFCTNKVKSVQNMFQNCNSLKNVDLSLLNLSNVGYLTYLFDGCSSLETIDLSGTTFITNASIGLNYMFNGCSSLTDLKLPSNSVKTSSIIYMFAGCSSLESITLPVIENVSINNGWGVDVKYLFSGCSSLKTINLNGLNTTYTTAMNNMFEGCSSLESIDVSGFNTMDVTDMSYMFKGCSTLTSLDLSNFNTANVTNMKEMFNGCSLMESIYVSCAWTAVNATSNDMFKDCASIVGQDGTTYIASSVNGTRATDEAGGYMKTGTDTEVEPTAYAIWVDEDTPFYFLQSTRQLVPGRLFTPEGSSTPLRMNKVWSGWKVSSTQGNQQWSNIRSNIKTVVFEPSFANVGPTTLACWFQNCSKLTTLTGLEYLDPNGTVQAMGRMFEGCTLLESIDLSDLNMSSVKSMTYMFNGCTKLNSVAGLKTPKVESMDYMFQNCTALETLDLSSFNTAAVTSMQYMFNGCTKLNNLNVKSFRTPKVTNMSYMFQNCSSLETLDLSSFSTEKLTSTNCMFKNCSNLVSIYVFNGTWDIKNKIGQYSSSQMFTGCTNIVGQDGTTYNSSNVTAAYAHAGTGGYLRAADMPVAIWCNSNKTLYFVKTADAVKAGATFMPEGSSTGVTVTSIWAGEDVTNTAANSHYLFGYPNWYSTVHESMTNVVFESTFADVTPNSTRAWFYYCGNLTTVSGLDNLNTAEVTNMSKMFTNCTKLTALDVSGFNTENVTDMSGMFNENNALETITGLNQFNTAKVTDMSSMFSGCWKLSTIDLSNFSTENVTDMTQMFARCVGLTSLDVTPLNTSKVTSMSSMFQSLPLATIDLSNFDTGNVTDMRCMFWLSKLEDVDLTAFNTEKVTSMYQMFFECPNLKNVNMGGLNTSNLTSVSMMLSECPNLERVDLSGWTNDKLTGMPWLFDSDAKLKEVNLSNFNTDHFYSLHEMFYGCSSLTSLDLSSFNTENVSNMYGLFYGCSALKSVIVGEGWTTESLSESVDIGSAFVNGKGDLFKNCTAIIGEDGTTYNSSNLSAAYAHTGSGGYLTKKETTLTANADGEGNYWASYYNVAVGCVADDATTVYTAKVNSGNQSVTLTEVEDKLIPAGNAVVLKSTSANVTMIRVAEEDELPNNDLLGTASPLDTPANAYCLIKGSRGVGFYKYPGTTIPAHRAYLLITGSSPEFMPIDGETTGISQNPTFPQGEEAWYTIDGRKLAGKPTAKGLYIYKGKKVTVK